MFFPTPSLSPVLYCLTARRRTARIVGIPGIADSAIGGLQMADQYENAARIGLDRVDAEYAFTIPFAFAFYGDLWQATAQGLQGAELPTRLASLGPFRQLYPLNADMDPVHAAIEVSLALEVLSNARSPHLGVRTDYFLIHPTLTRLLTELERSTPGVATSKVLWHFSTSIASYLTTPSLRALVLGRVAQEIEAGHEEVVLLAHGLGSLVCYDLLLRRPDLPVRCLITLGSPLGLASVRTALIEAIVSGEDAVGDTLPFPAGLPRWINLYNNADTIASAHLLSPLYRPVWPHDSRRVEDIDIGKTQPPAATNLFAGHHPATYLASRTAGLVLRSVVEQ